MSKKVKKTPSCKNCNQSLSGENYCPECGQLNDERRPGLWSFIIESLGNFFAFDSKFFQTIWHLFKRPGKVALEYKEGKKVAWMKPVRLYFLSSLIFLFLGGLGGENDIVEINGIGEDNANVAIEKENSSDILDSTEINSWKEENGLQKIYTYLEIYPDSDQKSAFEEMEIEDSWWNQFLFKQFKKQLKMEQKDFMQFLETKTFWILFMFLPLFSFWLKLLYRRKDIYYLEHLYFAFYTQSAFFILLSITSLNELVVKIPHFNGIVILGFLVYLFLALRNFYQQGIGKTILKFILLNLAYAISALFFFLLTLIIGFIVF